jgi:hypothetical protein
MMRCPYGGARRNAGVTPPTKRRGAAEMEALSWYYSARGNASKAVEDAVHRLLCVLIADC